MEAGDLTGRTNETVAAARAIRGRFAAGSAALSAAGARIARLTRHAGGMLCGNVAQSRSVSANPEAEYAGPTEAFTPPRSRADWHGPADWRDLVRRIPQPRPAGA